MEYARAKCTDVDGRLRDMDVCLWAELYDKVPKLLAAFETKLFDTSLPDLVAKSKEYSDGIVNILKTKTAKRIKVVEAALKAQEDQTKQHQA